MQYNLILAFYIVLLFCPGKAAGQSAGTDKSLLWEVSGRGMSKPSYIFGTIHVICHDKYLWTPAMDHVMEESDEICMEMDMDDPSILIEIASAMRETGGKKLEDYFSGEDYNLIRRYFADSLGIDISMFSGMKPYVLETMISTSSPNCDSIVSYEVKISEKAAQLKKEITGLESPAEQISLMEQIPTDTIIAELIKAAKGLDKDNDYDTLINAYTSQDLPLLYELILKTKTDGDNMNAFLDERNEKWVDRMVEKMDQKSIFFAVGAGHLWGEKGIISLLRGQGYTIKPIK